MRIRQFALMSLLLCTVLAVGANAQGRERIRIYVEESTSWEVNGNGGGFDDGFGGSIQGGARPQTAEIIKTFNERCADCIVTMKKEKADYIVMLQHEGGKDLVRKDNKYAVFDKEGDAIASGSTRSLGNAVKNACAAINRDLQEKAMKKRESEEQKDKNN